VALRGQAVLAGAVESSTDAGAYRLNLFHRPGAQAAVCDRELCTELLRVHHGLGLNSIRTLLQRLKKATPGLAARSTRWASGWAAWEVRAASNSPGAPRYVERPISPKRHPRRAEMAHGPPPRQSQVIKFAQIPPLTCVLSRWDSRKPPGWLNVLESPVSMAPGGSCRTSVPEVASKSFRRAPEAASKSFRRAPEVASKSFRRACMTENNRHETFGGPDVLAE
jgi:hypothetical protein